MSLPILQNHPTPSREDLLRFYDRTELHWARHVAEETTLDCGTALTNPELAEVHDANQMLDVLLPVGMSADEAMAQIDKHFRQQGTRCANIKLAPGGETRNAPLLELFAARGFTSRAMDVMYLAGQPSSPIQEISGLTIIPARASFRHARALEEEAMAQWNTPQLADAAMLHLDDSHVDALLALRDNVAVGSVYLQSVGEIGCIETLFVSAPFRGQGIGRTLMSRAMEICARSLFKHVFLSMDPANPVALKLYSAFGFKKIGDVVSYHPPRP